MPTRLSAGSCCSQIAVSGCLRALPPGLPGVQSATLGRLCGRARFGPLPTREGCSCGRTADVHCWAGAFAQARAMLVRLGPCVLWGLPSPRAFPPLPPYAFARTMCAWGVGGCSAQFFVTGRPVMLAIIVGRRPVFLASAEYPSPLGLVQAPRLSGYCRMLCIDSLPLPY